MVAFLLEWAQVDLFYELWPDWKLLVGEGFDVSDEISHSSPVAMHKGGQPIEGILLDFWLLLALHQDKAFSDHDNHHLVSTFSTSILDALCKRGLLQWCTRSETIFYGITNELGVYW